jgi:hypothetical protein
VYTDSIWKLSCCREFENELSWTLQKAIDGKKIQYRLVDTVGENYRSFDLVITDNIISNFQYLELWPEYWGSFSYNPHYQNNTPTRLFNCFINRTDTVRQSWFYQLVRRKLIYQGFVSFLLDYRKELLPAGIDIQNKLELYQWVFDQGCEIFAAEHELMKDQVPFQNFSGDLDQVICDSCISLVIETYFDRNDVIAFSEKIFRALQLPRPFLLYCASGAVKSLRDNGFDVYDDIVDHSYDNEPNSIQRQIKILDELEKARNIVYNNQVLDDFELRAQKNRSLLIELKNRFPKKLDNIIDVIKNYSGKNKNFNQSKQTL